MRLHTLQYLRAVASLFVVYSHAVIQVDSYTLELFEFGGFGVDIFFVISGFIMVYIARPDDTPARFIVNRARRVIPLYWFFTLLMALTLATMPELFRHTIFNIQQVIKSLLFVPHFSSAYPQMIWPIVAPGWSLIYEMYFYLLFALALFLPARWRIGFISFVILMGFIVAHGQPTAGPANQFFRDSIVIEFILGMCLAKAYLSGFRLPPSIAWVLLLTGLALLLLKFPLPRIVTWGVPSLLVVMGMLYSRLPANQFFVALGDSSYALYLSHIFTLGAMRTVLPPILGDGEQAAYLFVLISVLVCVVIGFVSHALVDNWLLRPQRKEKFSRLRSRLRSRLVMPG